MQAVLRRSGCFFSSPRLIERNVSAVTKAVRSIVSGSDRHFSTESGNSVTRKLVGAIESKLKYHESLEDEKEDNIRTPRSFPFTMKDDRERWDIVLMRDFQDEKIEVKVNPTTVLDFVKVRGKEPPPFKSVDINVSIVMKEKKKQKLEIGAYVSADRLVVHGISFPDPDSETRYTPTLRYNVEDDGGMLQYLLCEFVEIRGIQKYNLAFLYNYMVDKQKQYKERMPNADDFTKLKKFIQEW